MTSWWKWKLIAFDAMHEPDREWHYLQLEELEEKRRRERLEEMRRQLVAQPHDGERLTLSQALSVLDGVKKRGRRWSALCPAHEDTRPSLAVYEHSYEPDIPTFHCPVGCTPKEIRAAIRARL